MSCGPDKTMLRNLIYILLHNRLGYTSVIYSAWILLNASITCLDFLNIQDTIAVATRGKTGLLNSMESIY